MKQFLKWILCGIAMSIGWLLVQLIATLISDPYARARFKQKFRKD